MKLKSGKEVTVLGQVEVEGRLCYIVKATTFFHNDMVIPYVILPVQHFMSENLLWVGEVASEPVIHSVKVPEHDIAPSGEVQTEGDKPI
jgi:hypothetical protein